MLYQIADMLKAARSSKGSIQSKGQDSRRVFVWARKEVQQVRWGFMYSPTALCLKKDAVEMDFRKAASGVLK